MEEIPQRTQSGERDYGRPHRKTSTNRLVRHPRGDGDSISFRRLTNHAVAAFTMDYAQNRKTFPEQIEPPIVNRGRSQNIGIM
jgi:hypothetical protein